MYITKNEDKDVVQVAGDDPIVTQLNEHGSLSIKVEDLDVFLYNADVKKILEEYPFPLLKEFVEKKQFRLLALELARDNT